MNVQIAALTAAALLVGSVSFSSTVAENERSFVGYAYDLSTGELAYTEDHRERALSDGRGELATRYFDRFGKAIATRTASFDASPVAPGFVLSDHRTGAEEGLRHSNGELVMFQRPETDAERRERAINAGAKTLVADAGFDRFITRNWSRLTAGERMEAEFVVASRLKSVGVRIEKSDTASLQDEPAYRFRMSFANPLLRLIVGPIDVFYHQEHRFLMRYEGMSNIADSNGENYKVRIDFPLSERSDWESGPGAVSTEVRHASR